MANTNWLGDVPGTRLLHEICIPGSHDAGVYASQIDTRKSPVSWAQCQTGDIFQQATVGSRMFDCRVFLKMVGGALMPTMGHFFKEKSKGSFSKAGETGRGGAYGGSLLDCVYDAIRFVQKNPTEFLILRFSHTYCPTEVGAALNTFLNLGDNLKYIYTGNNNIAQQPLSSLRGKVIMVFASEFHTNFSSVDGYLPFYKYAPGVTTAGGLCTCGVYKGSDNMKKVHGSAEKGLDEHALHGGDDHLSFVYWQQTMKPGDIEAATTQKASKGVLGIRATKGGAHAQLTSFTDEIRDKVASGKWKLPNVISHDFVKDETCSQIIALNEMRAPRVRMGARRG